MPHETTKLHTADYCPQRRIFDDSIHLSAGNHTQLRGWRGRATRTIRRTQRDRSDRRDTRCPMTNRTRQIVACGRDVAIDRRKFDGLIPRSAGTERLAQGSAGESDEGDTDNTTRSKWWQRHQMPHDTTKPFMADFCL